VARRLWDISGCFNSDESLKRYESLLVTKGFTYGIGYSETFLSCLKIEPCHNTLLLDGNLYWPMLIPHASSDWR